VHRGALASQLGTFPVRPERLPLACEVLIQHRQGDVSQAG
jgi:hypothetical protein